MTTEIDKVKQEVEKVETEAYKRCLNRKVNFVIEIPCGPLLSTSAWILNFNSKDEFDQCVIINVKDAQAEGTMPKLTKDQCILVVAGNDEDYKEVKIISKKYAPMWMAFFAGRVLPPGFTTEMGGFIEM